jgi:hypothetical protein
VNRDESAGIPVDEQDGPWTCWAGFKQTGGINSEYDKTLWWSTYGGRMLSVQTIHNRFPRSSQTFCAGPSDS